MTVGVLAFHGDFAEHLEILRELRVTALEIRSLDDLKNVDRLIIPGGESTVMSRFLEETGMAQEIRRRVKNGKFPVYGTCAGAILLAEKVTGKNAPRSLGLMKITIDRNAYGTQLQSFGTELGVHGIHGKVPVCFIRAPIITKIGMGVQVLATHKGNPVLVRQGNLLAGTFHPEVNGETAIHEMFLSM